MLNSFTGDRAATTQADPDRVAVWLFVGGNGVGKTTTIGKLAKRQHDEGRSVLLAAGDTFRAAAADQLEQWATRSGAEIVRAINDPENLSLTIFNSASSQTTLMILLIMALIGLPMVIAYTCAVYWIFRGKVKLENTSY